MEQHTYIAIDLKSFFASVECVERGRNPLTTHLVVADESRTEKTICLAVTPSLKAYGISGRARLFEVVSKVKEVNRERARYAKRGRLKGYSDDEEELRRRPDLMLSYIVAPPRMSYYMEYSTRIYDIYLRYVAPEDIIVYSIDEVFMDVTHYLSTYHMTARQLTERMIKDVLSETGITATAGIGTNLYLCKVAMDIVAKHVEPDENGVRIAELDEMRYRRLLWNHQPITDFWRVGSGYQKRLAAEHLYTMGDIARCSLGKDTDYYNEDLLFRLFGVNAELLIDHAWGYEPCTIADVRAYQPEENSISTGQVLTCPYPFDKARIVVWEMADQMALSLVEKGLATDQLVLTVGYDIENIKTERPGTGYQGEITIDRYGRKVPKHAHGTMTLTSYTSSAKEIIKAVMQLYDKQVNPALLIRRITLCANRVKEERLVEQETHYEQMDLFTDYETVTKERKEQKNEREKERQLQQAMLQIKKKYGKNAILKAKNLEEGATMRERNTQIGGHKA